VTGLGNLSHFGQLYVNVNVAQKAYKLQQYKPLAFLLPNGQLKKYMSRFKIN